MSPKSAACIGLLTALAVVGAVVVLVGVGQRSLEGRPYPLRAEEVRDAAERFGLSRDFKIVCATRIPDRDLANYFWIQAPPDEVEGAEAEIVRALCEGGKARATEHVNEGFRTGYVGGLPEWWLEERVPRKVCVTVDGAGVMYWLEYSRQTGTIYLFEGRK